MKTCNKCGTQKPLLEFHVNKMSPDGYRHVCKDCTAAYRRKHQKLKHEEHGVKSKICVDCGKLKVFTEYYKDASHNDGCSSSCKICFNKHQSNTRKHYTKTFQAEQRSVIGSGLTCTVCGDFFEWDMLASSTSSTGKRSLCKQCLKSKQNLSRKILMDVKAILHDTVFDVNEFILHTPKHVSPFYKGIDSIRKRSIKKGLAFNLVAEEFLPIPTVCPLLGIPLFYTRNAITDNTPSFDRINPLLGYTKDNVWIISSKANRIKSNAQINEIELLLVNLKQKLKI